MKRDANILILGATSAIAQATARLWAVKGARFFLVGRNPEKLQQVADDLQVRGAGLVKIKQGDLLSEAFQQGVLKDATYELGGIDLALLAWGNLGDQRHAEENFSSAMDILNNNFLSYVSALTHLANYFTPLKKGVLVVISSVAGDRGRQSNYVYGSAKGGLSIFLQGLRNRLAHVNVHVLTVLPGFVNTPMTKNFKKSFLYSQPERIGRGIECAVNRRRNVVYLPWFWQIIMFIIRNIPERIFKKLRL